ncbi:hypothetical protein H8L32_17235 [Undibacterium sp. CY18W]|uniref:Uncharacterized protein n=1 Tax=Undibacterium hunanense TaxID=2762292 RepID=A0ABR6ZUK5_9BURK|nr:hypothetical protein [Undibacterium hunanense]MBC3919238.1 hypothetical protein [Undibacterium hunanense]
MKTKFIPLLLAGLLTCSAFAQSVSTDVQRNVNQQTRIEDGLKTGQLTTKEVGKLEREQAAIAREEHNALKDGKLSAGEKAKIDRMQNKASADIHAEKNDGRVGNPNSVSSKRMQADVQRNVNQQQRVENGIKSGELTNHEVAKLEKGQARVDHKEAVAAKNGHIGEAEQRNIQHAENHQSKKIHKEKTDEQVRG